MIIVGLGNPGKEYEQTRHNVGFAVVEKLAKKFQASPWRLEAGVVLLAEIGSHLLVEPMEYMNMSGPTLKRFLQKKNVESNITTDLFVVHDDVDFPLGEIHEQFDRSAAGHNGVQSVIDAYGQKFSRLRIGIGNNRDANVPAEDYVRQKFSADEKPIIDQAIDRAVEILEKKVTSA